MGNGQTCTPESAQQLLQEFRQTGQQAPFEEIVRRYAGMVYHVCFQVTKNSHDAEDVTQAVFLTLAVQAKTNRAIHALGPWLQQVAYRLALDMHKSKKRRKIREERHGLENGREFADDDARAVDLNDVRHLLTEELNKLPPKYRTPLILHYFGGLSREEMAKELGCKASTLGVRLYRGREMLGNRLAERGVALTGGLLVLAITSAVHAAITDSMIASTSMAATQMAAGQPLAAGVISARVLGLANGAAGAVAVGKFKTLAALLLVAGTAMAATAQVVSKVKPFQNLRFELPLDFSRLFRTPRLALPRLQSSAQPPSMQQGAEDVLAMEGSGPPVFNSGEPFALLPGQPLEMPSLNLLPPPQAARTLAIGLPPPPLEPPPALPPQPRANPLATPLWSPVLPLAAHTGREPAGRSPAPFALRTADPSPAQRPAESLAPPQNEPNAHPVMVDSRPAGRPKTLTLNPDAAPIFVGPLDTRMPVVSGNSPKSLILTPVPAAPKQSQPVQLKQLLPLGPDMPVAAADSASPDALTYASLPVGPIAAMDYQESAGSDGIAELAMPLAMTAQPALALPMTGDLLARSGAAAPKQAKKPLAMTIVKPYPEAFVLRSASLANTGNVKLSVGPLLATAQTWTADGQVLQGWGKPDITGDLDNSGQVIADGGGTNHSLDLTSIARLTNSVDNPADGGVNGWYARNKGRLQLPALAVSPANPTVTWGEEAGDPVLDLVNSVRLTVENPRQSGTIDLALLASDRTDIPDSQGLTILSLFAISSSDLTFDGLDLTVRYDEAAALAAGIDESALQLWQYDGSWRRISDGSFALDRSNNLISGHAIAPSYLAVTTPEPGGLLLLAAGGLLLARRRSRVR